MRSERLRHVLAPFLLALSLAGCMGQDNAPSDEDLQEERVVRLIDERRYGDAIRLLEPAMQDPGKKDRFGLELVEAHLGAAGFEPLRFATRILGAQPGLDDTSASRLDAIIPSCPGDAIRNGTTLPSRCWMKRLFTHLPEADDPHLSRARDLLRDLAADPEKAAPRANLFAAVVETASAISRTGTLLRQYQALDPDTVTDEQLQDFFRQTGRIAAEARRGLQCARHSDYRVVRILTGIEDAPVFRKTGVSLELIENTGIPLLIRVTDAAAKDSMEGTVTRIILLQAIEELSSLLAGGLA